MTTVSRKLMYLFRLRDALLIFCYSAQQSAARTTKKKTPRSKHNRLGLQQVAEYSGVGGLRAVPEVDSIDITSLCRFHHVYLAICSTYCCICVVSSCVSLCGPELSAFKTKIGSGRGQEERTRSAVFISCACTGRTIRLLDCYADAEAVNN